MYISRLPAIYRYDGNKSLTFKRIPFCLQPENRQPAAVSCTRLQSVRWLFYTQRRRC